MRVDIEKCTDIEALRAEALRMRDVIDGLVDRSMNPPHVLVSFDTERTGMTFMDYVNKTYDINHLNIMTPQEILEITSEYLAYVPPQD